MILQIGIFLLLTAKTSQAELPQTFSENISEQNFAEMYRAYPRSEAARTPWIGSWWPFKDDGIAALATENERHSPAKKYDLIMGARSRDGAYAWEKANHGAQTPGVEDWWGHCNGWTAAALMVPEPRESVVIRGHELTAADLKGLLSEVYMEVSSDFLGTRHNEKENEGASFRDITPAQLHLTLVNLLGKLEVGFALDRSPDQEVWNHPVVGYWITPPEPSDQLPVDPEAPGIFPVRVRTQVWIATDEVFPDELSPRFEYRKYSKKFPMLEYEYRLWLDAPLEFDDEGNLLRSGNILQFTDPDTGELLGGEWISTDHPDFFWLPYAVAPPSGFKNPAISSTAVLRMSRGKDPSSSRRE